MIVDTSYFTLPPLYVPNAVVQPLTGNNLPTNIQRLQSVIDTMEYQLLVNALGVEQYNDLRDNPTQQKWIDLLNGKGNWKGLSYTIGTTKKSLIANYIYYNFLLEDEFYYTTTGIVKPNAENASNVSAVSKLVRVWNQFVFMYQGFNYGCGCYEATNTEMSLLEFLNSDKEAYNTDSFRIYELQNSWGI